MTKQPTGFWVVPWQKHEVICMGGLVFTFAVTLAFTAGYLLGVSS